MIQNGLVYNKKYINIFELTKHNVKSQYDIEIIRPNETNIFHSTQDINHSIIT